MEFFCLCFFIFIKKKIILNLEIENLSSASFTDDSTEKTDPVFNIVFNFWSQLVQELRTEILNSNENGIKITFEDEIKKFPLIVKLSSSNYSELESFSYNLINKINKNINLRLFNVVNDKFIFLNQYLTTLDELIAEIDNSTPLNDSIKSQSSVVDQV